jgi:hypothetical protein
MTIGVPRKVGRKVGREGREEGWEGWEGRKAGR